MMPQHVALIMDGNRRWAKERGLPSLEGHLQGEDCIEPIVDAAIELGIPYLTFWAFSTENWNRSESEVAFLLNLYRDVLHKKVDDFHKKNVRVHVIGNISLFPKDIQEKTAKWMEQTKNNTKITVNIALSYGGRDEILRAIDKWHGNYAGADLQSGPEDLRSQQLSVNRSRRTRLQTGSGEAKITPEEFAQYLDTAGQPDPDLLIRTGGTQRLSGFLLWQLEYAELYFTETLWPDFTPKKFQEALTEFKHRQRRFGK